jgi:phage terminase large subunit GpA-like protein
VAVGIAKLEFYNNLRKGADVGEDGLTTVFRPGSSTCPRSTPSSSSSSAPEQLITRRDRNGFPVREWQKMRERNEALDCYVYARAAASAAGLDRFEERHWRELERQLGWNPTMSRPHSNIDPTRPPNAVASLFLQPQHRSARVKSRWLVLTFQGENMSLATRIESLVIRVAQEFNDVRAKAGNLANLPPPTSRVWSRPSTN